MDYRKCLLVRVTGVEYRVGYERIPGSRRSPVSGIFGSCKQPGRSHPTNVVPSVPFVTSHLRRSPVPCRALRICDFVFTGK